MPFPLGEDELPPEELLKRLHKNETRIIPKGSLVMLSRGEYSDYSVGPICRATRDIEIEENPKNRQPYPAPEQEEVQRELLRAGALVELDYFEWHDDTDRAVFHRGFKRRINMERWVCGVIALLISVPSQAQVDPGIRSGVSVGQAFVTGLTVGERTFFNEVGVPEFTQVEGVEDGLGPRFNLDSCAGCHAYPAIGGSSPPMMNPQVVRAPQMAPGNTIPSFLKIDGPIREVRFIRGPSPFGELDGSVHSIFTIAGRSDSPNGCTLKQPDFDFFGPSNLSFRIPTPLFGLGLIESITDVTIRNNLASDPTGLKRFLGIRGHVNTSGNDGTVTRFGWKAQNKSLLMFSGEAYNVEMGVTNELFPNERSDDPKCATNPLPENRTADTEPANIVAFMAFMKFMDQPTPACGVVNRPACSSSIVNGRALFEHIGCSGCHTPLLTTGASSTEALHQKPVRLFSDLALHHMGYGLADFILQGQAGFGEFRTAPLWGVGQRAFFLHDGRTKDLLTAILAHGDPGSEAFRVIDLFSRLAVSQKQDILNFLRSL